jgi:hypothetical protein
MAFVDDRKQPVARIDGHCRDAFGFGNEISRPTDSQDGANRPCWKSVCSSACQHAPDSAGSLVVSFRQREAIVQNRTNAMRSIRVLASLIFALPLAGLTIGCNNKAAVTPPVLPPEQQKVEPSAPKTLTGSLSTELGTIERGQSVTLRSSTGASELTIAGLGDVEAVGTRKVRPLESTLISNGPAVPARATAVVTLPRYPMSHFWRRSTSTPTGRSRSAMARNNRSASNRARRAGRRTGACTFPLAPTDGQPGVSRGAMLPYCHPQPACARNSVPGGCFLSKEPDDDVLL